MHYIKYKWRNSVGIQSNRVNGCSESSGSGRSDFVTLSAPFDDLPKRRLPEMMDSRIHKGCGQNIISHLLATGGASNRISPIYMFDRWCFISFFRKLVYSCGESLPSLKCIGSSTSGFDSNRFLCFSADIAERTSVFYGKWKIRPATI